MDKITKEVKETIGLSQNNADELTKIVAAYFLAEGKGFDSVSDQEKKDALFIVSVAYYQGYQRGMKEAKGN